MNNIQKKLVLLLDELDLICRDHKIKYCLADRLAWDAVKFGKFHDETLDAFVMMHEASLQSFIRAVSLANPENRKVEKIGAGLARYTSLDSTLIDLVGGSGYSTGISVTIKLIEKENGFFLCANPSGKKVRFSFDLVEGCPLQRFENHEYPIPSDVDAYFSTIVGKAWRKRNYKGPINRYRFGIIADEVVPYKVYREKIDNDGLSVSKVINASRVHAAWKRTQLKSISNRIEEMDNLAHWEAVRFRLCEKYYPSKKRLLNAWERGRKDQVCKALDEYLYFLKYYYDEGKTIYFDSELFDLALKALEYQGWDEAVSLTVKNRRLFRLPKFFGATKLKRMRSMVSRRHVDVELSSLIGDFILD